MGMVWGATYGGLNLSYLAVLACGFIFANSNAFIDNVAVYARLASAH